MPDNMVDLKFLVPGFSKCGTTTLCSLINQHPDIFIPAEKEPWYFSSPRYAEKHQEYIDYFRESKPGQILGEGSTAYSGYKTEKPSIARISEHYPDCRFIFIARDPIKRIESSYRELHHSGAIYNLEAEYRLCDTMKQIPQMIADTLYMDRIMRYREAFGDESILVLFLEELEADPHYQLKRCFRHIGVDDSFEIANTDTRLNAGETKLYDTRIFRYLRNHKKIGPRIAKMNAREQDRVFKKYGLRRAFKKPVVWDTEAIKEVTSKVLPNTREFLAFYGKPGDYWPNPFD
jgi:hypothetical protein